LKLCGLEWKGSSMLGANRDGEKTNGLPRGLSRHMDQPPGHRMGAGVTRLLSIYSTESLGYGQSWKLLPTRLPLL
jgi:hypothetical protein